MARYSNLDDPEYARFAWARYWQLMRQAGLVALGCIVLALAFLFSQFGMVSIHLYIAAALGVGLMILLAAALMGLTFLSSGSGHDDAVEDPLEGELLP